MSTETISPDNTTALVLTEEEIFKAHEGGKLTVSSTVPLNDKRDLSIAYTPASPRSAAPSMQIRSWPAPTPGPSAL